MLVLSVGSTVQAQPPGSGTDVPFDIPAQPLAAALEAYNAVTGKDVFYDGAAGAGRESSAVKGELTPDNALRIMLEGTGFVILPNNSGAYTLIQAPERAANEFAVARMAQDQPYASYFAIIQANMHRALCGARSEWQSRDRLLIRFWIGPSGALERPELIRQTGELVRDADLVAMLRTIVFSQPPPRAMPQPVTMVAFPQKRLGKMACGKGESNHASR